MLVLVLSMGLTAQKPDRTIAVTIDDLPVVSTRSDIEHRRQITRKLLAHIKKAKIPAIGFVNENKLYVDGVRSEEQVDLLRMWIGAGLELGNHTYSHRSLNRIDLSDYIADVLKGETITRELLQKKKKDLRFFRHPFLQTGRSLETKAQFASFLEKNGYTIAPVTHDNADYIFARAYDIAFDKKDLELQKKIGEAYVPYMEAKLDYWERQSTKLFGREISQTLLIHANSINADYLDELAKMLNRRGYRFVSLETSVKDDAYKLPDNFIGAGGISWLHRWALDKGREYIVPDEPAVPEFVMKASGFTSE